MLKKMNLTPKQRQVILDFFADGEDLEDGWIELYDSEERTALALERKGLITRCGLDVKLTENGKLYAKTYLGC